MGQPAGRCWWRPCWPVRRQAPGPADYESLSELHPPLNMLHPPFNMLHPPFNTHMRCQCACRTQDVPAMLVGPAGTTSAVLRTGSFAVAPCPGPDDINWPTLWCTWQMVRREGRGWAARVFAACAAHALCAVASQLRHVCPIGHHLPEARCRKALLRSLHDSTHHCSLHPPGAAAPWLPLRRQRCWLVHTAPACTADSPWLPAPLPRPAALPACSAGHPAPVRRYAVSNRSCDSKFQGGKGWHGTPGATPAPACLPRAF